MESLDELGLWWLPGAPEDQVAGRLRFDPVEGSTLDLVGQFRPPRTEPNPSPIPMLQEHPIVLGVIPGKRVTLYKCFQIAGKISAPGFVTSSFHVSSIFLGGHFPGELELVFESFHCRYTNLSEWVGTTGLSGHEERDPNGRLLRYTVTYNPLERQEAQIDEGTVALDWSVTFSGIGGGEAPLRETVQIFLRPDAPAHYDRYVTHWTNHVQDFLSLAVGRAVYPLNLTAHPLRRDDSILSPVTILYAPLGVTTSPKRVRSWEMLFTLADIGADFGRCLASWFRQTEALRPVFSLYFGTLYNPSLYLEHRFLSLMQALESYHRRKYGGLFVDADVYEPIRAALEAAIPPQTLPRLRDALTARLKYGNEFSLGARLRDLIRRLGDVVSAVIPDPDRFITEATNTRNFLTHYSNPDTDAKTMPRALFALTQRAKALLEFCLLFELDLSREQVAAIVARSRQYQYVLGL